MRFPTWIPLASLIVCLGQARPARADTFETRAREAKRACLSGDFGRGQAILADLFVDSGDPTYLFNQGRCFEQNVRYQDAVGRFNEYLLKAPRATEAEQAEARAHIAFCETELRKSATLVAPAPAPAPAPEAEAAAGASTERSAPTPWQRTGAWIAAGTTVAALGLAVVEHVRYARKGHEFNDLVKQRRCNDAAADKGGATCSSLADAQDTAGALALLGYGAATLAAGAAIYFWLTVPSQSPGNTRARARFACAPEARGLGVVCAGNF